MTFKTIFSDINKVAVARDSLSGIRFDSKNVVVVEAYKNAIKGLNEEQARYVLSKRYVSEADQADLLTKAEIIAANDGVKASELSRQLVLHGVRKEQAEALIEQISGNEAITSNTVLTKEQTTAILEQAEARKILSAQQRKNIADDIEETASSAQEASAEMAQASADVAESGTKMGSASSILARSVSQLGVGFKSLLSIFVSSPVAAIATLTGSVIGLTYVIGKFQDTAKNAAKTASEFSSSMSSANSTYNQESDSLNDLTEKYEDLREQLISAKGDEEKTYDIKSQLLELQEQLNDIYGDECDKVNLVTDAYKDQTAELKKNAKQKADNYLNTHVDEINEATKKMTTDYEYELGNFNYGLQDASVGNELHEQIKKLAEKSGIEWDDNKGFVFKGTAEEASKAIDQFMTDVRELRDSEDGLSDGIINNLKAFDSSMSDQLEVANEIIDGYQETYETAQMAQIASDKDLSQGYNEAVSAVEAYNDAVSKSDNPYDDENVKKAWDNLQTVKSGIQSNEDEWGQYSNIMNKVFSSASDDVYSFYQAIQNDDSIKSLTNDLQGLTDIDLQSMANDDTEDSFDKLCKAAKKYGLEVQDVIDLLIQLGIVQGKVQEQNSNETPISFEIPDADTLQQQISDLNSAIDSIQSAYDTLNSAVEEYNSNGGQLSIDTIQSLLSLSDEYLACLQVENGQLSLNADAMAQLAQSKLDDAQATAVTQAMTELQAIANGEAAQSTTNYITGNAALMSSLAQLSGSYDGVAKAAMTAAQAQRMSALISDAAGKDKTATENVMKGLDTKLKLIQTTKASINAGNFGKIAGKSSSSSKGSGSGKSASDTAKEEIEAYMEYLEKVLEGGRITYSDYVRDVTLKLDDMYHNGRITAKEYFDYVEKRLNQQLEVYKSVLSAVTDLLEDEVQKWQDKIDALNDENDLLEKQKDDYDSILSAVDQVYQDEIDRLNEQKDLLQDKIDAINDENDALELQRKKQEALIALDKARQQRNVKIYTEGRGYFYDIDQDAYKDAQQNLQDIKNEEVIKKLEDEQDALDNSIELLEKYRDLWNDIADAYKQKTNEALAVALWGENYEKLILQNRTQDIEAFKDKYLEIQSKIDDNKSLIDSYQEKVDYYNKLKEQWSDISSAYEKEQQRMYAAQILGANWEKDVLDGRLDVLSQFRDQYLEIQRQMTQAALDGARARNDAAASGGTGGTGGSGGSSGGGGGSTPIQNQKAYHVLHLVGGYSTSGEASSKISSFNGKGVYKYKDGKWYVYKEEDYSNLSFGSESEADDYIKKHLSPAGKFLVKYYHNGLENGLVDFSKKDSNFDLVQKYGLKKYEVPAILKQGEAVMNQEQIKNLGEALRAIPTAATLYTTPDYTKMLSSLKTNNTPVMVTQSVNITLPNVTNNSGYENLTRELNRLKLDAYQFANRRN